MDAERHPRREGKGAALHPPPGPRRWCSASTRAGTLEGGPVAAYREEKGGRTRVEHRDLRRPTRARGQLALAGGALLPEDRQAAGPARSPRSRSTSGRRRCGSSADGRLRAARTCCASPSSPTRGSSCGSSQGAGQGDDARATPTDFFDNAEVHPLPEAYQTLLFDVIEGDQTLFVRADEVEASWRLFDPAARPCRPPAPPLPGGGVGGREPLPGSSPRKTISGRCDSVGDGGQPELTRHTRANRLRIGGVPSVDRLVRVAAGARQRVPHRFGHSVYNGYRLLGAGGVPGTQARSRTST